MDVLDEMKVASIIADLIVYYPKFSKTLCEQLGKVINDYVNTFDDEDKQTDAHIEILYYCREVLIKHLITICPKFNTNTAYCVADCILSKYA